MEQAVDAAEVDERAEVGDVLHDALADLTLLEFAEQLALHFRTLIFDQLAARHDDVPALLVDLQDHAADFLADVVADIVRTADINLAGGQEDVDAAVAVVGDRFSDVDEQAALDFADHDAVDDIAFFLRLNNAEPVLHPIGFPLGKHDQALFAFNFFEQDFNLVAGLRLALFVGPFAQGHDAFTLVADVDQDLFAIGFKNRSDDDLVGVKATRGGVDNVVEALAGSVDVHHAVKVIAELRIQLVVIDIEFTNQVPIDHVSLASSAFVAAGNRTLERPPQIGKRRSHSLIGMSANHSLETDVEAFLVAAAGVIAKRPESCQPTSVRNSDGFPDDETLRIRVRSARRTEVWVGGRAPYLLF